MVDGGQIISVCIAELSMTNVFIHWDDDVSVVKFFFLYICHTYIFQIIKPILKLDKE